MQLATEFVHFTRRYKPPSCGPLRLYGAEVELKEKALFKGLTLDKKQSWKPKIANRLRQTSIALYVTKYWEKKVA